MKTEKTVLCGNEYLTIRYVATVVLRPDWDECGDFVTADDLYAVSVSGFRRPLYVRRTFRCSRSEDGGELVTHFVISRNQLKKLSRSKDAKWLQREVETDKECHDVGYAVLCFLNTGARDYRYAVYHACYGEQQEVARRPYKTGLCQ